MRGLKIMKKSDRFAINTASYEQKEPYSSQQYLMFGHKERAKVVRDILPGRRGRIAWGNTTWFALSNENIYLPAGTIVDLLDRDGNTWLVQAVVNDSSHAA